MLKGYLDIDIDFMGGSIIFGILVIVILTALVLPMISMSFSVFSSEKLLDAVEFSNLAKAKMQNEKYMGDGEGGISAIKMRDNIDEGTEWLGLGDSFIFVDDIVSGSSWKIGSNHGNRVHEVYSTLSTSEIYVKKRNYVLMEPGSEYIVNIYRNGEDAVVDIYTDYVCNQGKSLRDPNGFVTPSCEEMIALREVADESILKDTVTGVITGINPGLFALVVPSKEIDTGSLLRLMDNLIEDDLCMGRGNACVRIIGDFRTPLKIRTELSKD